MSKKKPSGPRKTTTLAEGANPSDRKYRVLLWLVFFAGALFLIPQCLDRYLAPRFFWTSAVLLGGLLMFWRQWQRQGDWRLHGFDLLLLAWYGLNIVSVAWAFSWSEGVFYAQKVLLLFGVYWLMRQAMHHDEALVRRTLAAITATLSLVVSGLLIIQIGLAVSKHGLDNQHLYDYASGVFGNKGLATDFLFFLLIFNFIYKDEFRNKQVFPLSAGVLLLLILLLQTRTVYLALALSMVLYLGLRIAVEPPFRPFFFKKILPAGALAIGLLVALLSWKGSGSTLVERLNPATYLESASANERRLVWYKTDLLNRDHYWLGVGNGSWKIWLPSKSLQGAFRLQEQGIVFTRAHNDYLEIRAEMGITGATLFITLFAVAFFAAGYALRNTTDVRSRHDLMVLLAGLAGYCVIQYFDFPRERIELQVLLGLMFALMAWQSRAVWMRLPGLTLSRQAPVLMGLLAAGLAFNLVMGWHRIQGETRMVKVMEAQTRGDFPALLRAAESTRNAFYEFNDVAIPLQWYEGIALYQTNRINESVAAFKEAHRLNPWAFQVLNNYASALVQAGRYHEAIPLFEQALEINPRYDEGKFNLAYAWYVLGDRTRAEDWINKVDTIPAPPSDKERLKNQAILKKKAEFIRAINQAKENR